MNRNPHPPTRSSLSLDRYVHWLLFLVVGVLLLIGIRAILCTDTVGVAFETRDSWVTQCAAVCVGLGLAIAVLVSDYRKAGAVLFACYFLSLAMLVYVLLFGRTINGAQRWIHVLGQSVQPGSFARFTTLLTFCFWLSPRCPFSLPKSVHRGIAAGIVLVPAWLIAIEPAWGNALVLVLTAAVVAVLHYLDPGVLKRLCLYVAVGFAVAQAELAWLRGLNIERWMIEESLGFLPVHNFSRFVAFLSQTGSWNSQQSVLCIVSGGLWGKGSAGSFLHMLGYLPRGVAPSDFVFSVIGEVYGFAGCVTVLVLLSALIAIGYRIAARASDPFGRLAGTAITTAFALHAAINCLMVVRLGVVIGLPLPFVSKGGTFAVVCLLGMGLLAAIHRRTLAVEASAEVNDTAREAEALGLGYREVLNLGPLLRLHVAFDQDGPAGWADTLCAAALERARENSLLFPLEPYESEKEPRAKRARKRIRARKGDDERQGTLPNLFPPAVNTGA